MPALRGKYKPMNQKVIIEKYLEALPANEYDIRLVHATDKEKNRTVKRTWTKEQILSSINFLKAKNANGYNVYCRPLSYEYVLLDDLKREVLDDLAKLQPCLLMETSPNNFQAFIHLSQMPENREIAFLICQDLCQIFDADKASAEPDHIGRLPGFTNQKPKYQDANGLFPFVKLHKSKDRLSTYQFSPQSGLCAKKDAQSASTKKRVNNNTQIDQSRADFNLACMLIRQGKDDSFIYEKIKLQFNSDKHKETDYIPRTIKNARKLLSQESK
jgi:hypothetical protein